MTNKMDFNSCLNYTADTALNRNIPDNLSEDDILDIIHVVNSIENTHPSKRKLRLTRYLTPNAVKHLEDRGFKYEVIRNPMFSIAWEYSPVDIIIKW